MTEPQIYVVDGDAMSRQAIAELAVAMEIGCQSFVTAEELLAEVPLEELAVVVCEFRLLGINGIELQHELMNHDCYCQMIFHTAYAETKLTVTAMQNGAVTVLEKPASEQDLWDAMRQAVVRWRDYQRRGIEHSKIRSRLGKLTRRERSVLRKMMEGLPNKNIARQLEVSVRTVENCRHNIFKKTRTDSVAELVRQVVEIAPTLEEL